MLLIELLNHYFTLAFVFRFQIGKEWWLIFRYVYSRNVAFISSRKERCICIAQIAWYYWRVALINNIWSIMTSGYIRNKTLLFITVSLSWFSLTFALFSCSSDVVEVKTHSTQICFAFLRPDFTFGLCFGNISISWLLVWLNVLELLRIKSHTLAISRFLGAFSTSFISRPREALRRILIIIKASKGQEMKAAGKAPRNLQIASVWLLILSNSKTSTTIIIINHINNQDMEKLSKHKLKVKSGLKKAKQIWVLQVLTLTTLLEQEKSAKVMENQDNVTVMNNRVSFRIYPEVMMLHILLIKATRQ